MKTVALLLVALVGAVAAKSHQECVADCTTKILQEAEQTCKEFRDELPRPDLYNHCLDGNRAGRDASCPAACSGNVRNNRRLDMERLDACDQYRGRPPSDRLSACQKGFSDARTAAAAFVEANGVATQSEPEKPAETQSVETKPVESKPAEPEKRKLSGNSPISPKSVLEAAREEAAAAFQDAKVNEL